MQAVAYATRSALFEERRGIAANYTYAKDHDVFWETLSPEGSGIDKKDLSIWNKADQDEDKILTRRHTDPEILLKKIATARTAYDDEFSLPKELSREQNIELVREYVNTKFIRKGLVSTYSIHWEEGNPHVHIVYSSRAYKDGEFSPSKTVSRDLRGPGGVRGLRDIAAHTINKYQELAGLEDRVDPRSYAERGIDLIPTQHKGWMSHQLEREGLSSRIAQDNVQISEENKERIAREPGIIIKELTSTQATFSQMDIVRLMQHRLKDDVGILGDHVLHGVMEQAVEVGTGIDDFKRYTSQDYADKEAKILESFEEYQTHKAHLKIDPLNVEAFVESLQEQGKETGIVPNEGQINGVRTLCGDSRLVVMIGRAGTGKTTTLKAVVKLHEDAGFKVIGMAPSATAASQLEADTGCKSDTIAHYAYYWNKYDEALQLLYAATTDKEMSAAQKAIDKYSAYIPNSDTVIIIDEAGMVGVGDHKGRIPGGWDAITKAINNTGAKLILTGDDHQFKPVEAGDVLRRLIYTLRGSGHLCELTDIMRQNIPWMREASKHLAELNISTALGMYETHGHIEGYSSNTEVYEAIAQQYLRNMMREPDSNGIVVASTNEERLSLNREIRSLLKENGHLPQEDMFQRGEDGYCVGDKIIFTKNDRGWNTKFESQEEGFFVQNSMQAVIQFIKPIRLKDQETGEVTETYEIVAWVSKHKATVKFNLEDYKDFAHAYAVTGFKSQAATLDWVLVKASRFMDAHGLYVCLTRHRQDISLYYSQEEFATYQTLVNSLSRANIKDLVVDYSVSDEHQEYWQNVQDYKETGRELQGIRALAKSLNKEDKQELDSIWENYRHVEEDRKSWAKFILEDWESHKDFVRQAGLTRESLEIAAGLKKRSMSRVEKEAQSTVEQYIAVSLETRGLWRDIRRTHPGARAKSHSEWPKFEDARNQRGVLANQICLNPILYRPFLKETAENLAKADMGYVTKDNKISYSMATIKAQAEAHQSKILQQELLKGDKANLAEKDRLKVLVAYTENRDMAGTIWQEVRPKLKGFEGTLLKEAFTKAISEYTEIRMKRDGYAAMIMAKPEDCAQTAEKVGIKLDFERLAEQAVQAKRDMLLKTWQSSTELTAKLEAAFDLHTMLKSEAELEKKPTVSFIYQQGVQPKDITRDALEYQKLKLYEGLKTEPERSLFLLLDDYDSKCRAANQLYSLCIEDTKGKDKNAWESSHYRAYKDACHTRNDLALEIFDQRDHGQVLAMAEAMGIRFKDVELEEIFSRCEQATRTNHIISYLKAEDSETKGKAAVAIRQMIEFERREANSPSKTAQQAYHSGIDFKELQTTAFEYGRAVVLATLSTEAERVLFHTLVSYEQSSRTVNLTYKECINESKEKTTKDLEVKPWKTEKFKDYISLVTIQDEKAYELIKGYDASSINRIAKEMGISPKKLDVEAHRHSLRQTLHTFINGDRTNVPMAGQELQNWLDFDRHSDHNYTFKVLREQDIWPRNIQESLQEFFEKKREWRQEEHRSVKDAARTKTQGHNLRKPEYQTITYERYQSFEEVDKQLKERMFELATHVLGNPTSRTSTQLRFGRKGSICVFTNGPKQGLYANHETGVYGGPLKMIEEQAGLSSARDSLKWATDWLGGNPLVIEHRVVEKQQEEEKFSTWTPITPVPKEVAPPDIKGNKYLNYMLKDGNKEVARYAYRDEQGRLKGYVFRFERPNPNDPGGKNLKITPPLAYCQNEKGFKAWRWQGFFGDQKTAYGLEKLAQDPSKPVLVVEGEKKADAAQKMLPEYHVLSWIGGAGNVGKTNWECLAGREVTIWPDNDSGGFIAADTLQKIVSSINTEKGRHGSVSIVSLPQELPEKWDLADNLPEGWSIETIRQMIKEAMPFKDRATVIPQEQIANSELEKKYTPEEQKILDYLNQELTPEKSPWLDESDFKVYRKAAEANPARMLARWQEITDDYSFNVPAQDAPKPLTEQQQLAQKLLASVEDFATPRMIREWNELLSHSPQAVIDECQNLIEQHKSDMESLTLDARREIAAQKFLSMCDEMQNLRYGDPRLKSIERDIEAITATYLKDEQFIEKIKGSKNENAIQTVNEAIYQQERSRARGHSLDM